MSDAQQIQLDFDVKDAVNEAAKELVAEAVLMEEVAAEPQVYSVSEINRLIKDTLEKKCSLVWLRGEISNFKPHTSGHFYFAVKDAKSQISAVMFRGFNSRLKFKPEDGMEVLIRGRITVYEPRGNYQIFCEVMEPVGVGALQKAYEQLKVKLEGEGLFDQKRKRPMPVFPKRIAIVTSPTGAAIRDMLNVLGRRFKGIEITLIPSIVQGDAAAKEIVAAINLANRVQPPFDVMIVGRGGGSIEDMWCFNEEKVARAIATSKIPVISAVGHEVDFTIADFVADLRAPTPSAAAELVVPNSEDVRTYAQDLLARCQAMLGMAFKNKNQEIRNITKRLIDPKRRLQEMAMRCDELEQRLEMAILQMIHQERLHLHLMQERLGNPLSKIEDCAKSLQLVFLKLKNGISNGMHKRRSSLNQQMSVLDSISPLRVVDRGYSIVSKGTKIIRDVADLIVGESIEVKLAQGAFTAKVENIRTEKN